MFTYKNGILKISVEPRKRYMIIIDLRRYSWITKDYDRIGGLILTKDELTITVKKEVRMKKVKKWASFDINLTNITALVNGKIVRYDLKQLYHIHRAYEVKRKKIQKLSKRKPKTAKTNGKILCTREK